MLTADGWFDWAVHDPGPKRRQEFYGRFHRFEAVVHHSMEGTYRLDVPGAFIVIRHSERFPTAWCGTVDNVDGTLAQHYDVRAMLVHAHDGNPLGPGFELEGFAGEPISDAAIATFRRIHRDIAEFTGEPWLRTPEEPLLGGLVEHREVAGPVKTTCPSGRYDRLWEILLEEEDDMDEETVRAIVREEIDAIIGAHGYGTGEDGTRLGRLVEVVDRTWQRINDHQSLPRHEGGAPLDHEHRVQVILDDDIV
ncbi:MAG: hypothetical protein ACOC9T_00115 [Myxococcota bacterium]